MFEGKVAAITGTASGIGRALAIELAARGCHLSLSSRDEVALAETARLAHAAAKDRDKAVHVTTTRVDVADQAAIVAWAAETQRQHGVIHLIFNNAGVGLGALLEEVNQTDFEWIMTINFWGVVWGTQAFLPYLKASGDGHVVNISSLFGLLSVPGNGCYNASKFAVRGYTEALRMELELTGSPVSATCVHPGGVRTNIARVARLSEGVQRLTGIDLNASRAQFDRMLNMTTAESAARQILRAVQSNKRRALVGLDARFMDKVVRLLGSAYQPLMVFMMRKMRRRSFSMPKR